MPNGTLFWMIQTPPVGGVDDLPNVNEMEPLPRFGLPGRKQRLATLDETAKGWRLDAGDELPDDFIKEIRIFLKAADRQYLSERCGGCFQ